MCVCVCQLKWLGLHLHILKMDPCSPNVCIPELCSPWAQHRLAHTVPDARNVPARQATVIACQSCQLTQRGIDRQKPFSDTPQCFSHPGTWFVLIFLICIFSGYVQNRTVDYLCSTESQTCFLNQNPELCFSKKIMSTILHFVLFPFDLSTQFLLVKSFYAATTAGNVKECVWLTK